MDAPVTVLDGGMGRQLERSGAPFRQPEWSALALMEAPATVRAAHDAFIAAGAAVITTNSYALVPFHIGEDRFRRDAERLAALSGLLARQAAAAAPHPVRVAGSLPPPFGSYRPDLFDPVRAPAILAPLVAGLRPAVDFFLAETQSSVAEARAACTAAGSAGKPVWVSYTLAGPPGRPTLRSGEPVEAAVAAATEAGAAAVLFNCCPPELIGPALDMARAAVPGLPLGAYANIFDESDADAPANETVSTLRGDVGPARYAAFARDWRRRGATVIGGCCGIGPAHIRAIGCSPA